MIIIIHFISSRDWDDSIHDHGVRVCMLPFPVRRSYPCDLFIHPLLKTHHHIPFEPSQRHSACCTGWRCCFDTRDCDTRTHAQTHTHTKLSINASTTSMSWLLSTPAYSCSTPPFLYAHARLKVRNVVEMDLTGERVGIGSVCGFYGSTSTWLAVWLVCVICCRCLRAAGIRSLFNVSYSQWAIILVIIRLGIVQTSSHFVDPVQCKSIPS